METLLDTSRNLKMVQKTICSMISSVIFKNNVYTIEYTATKEWEAL